MLVWYFWDNYSRFWFKQAIGRLLMHFNLIIKSIDVLGLVFERSCFLVLNLFLPSIFKIYATIFRPTIFSTLSISSELIIFLTKMKSRKQKISLCLYKKGLVDIRKSTIIVIYTNVDVSLYYRCLTLTWFKHCYSILLL